MALGNIIHIEIDKIQKKIKKVPGKIVSGEDNDYLYALPDISGALHFVKKRFYQGGVDLNLIVKLKL